MERDQVVATWMSFMLTALRKACGLSRSQAAALAHTYKLSAFLAAHYELLHYYDNEYVVDDLIRFVHEQGGADELSRTH